MALTPKQQKILEYYKKYFKKKGYFPSLQEAGKHFRLVKSTIHKHIKNLKERGYLDKINYRARGINIFEKEKLVSIPLLGMIAAGQQVEMFEQKGESIAIPKTKIKPNQNYFGLKVSGESMIEKNINDGDIVLVKQQSTADNGDNIVALIDNKEATLKTFYKESGHIRLQPANRNMSPIIIEKERDFAIQGVVVDVIKQTGYSIYKEEFKMRVKKNMLESVFPELPNKKFDIIYADPPWHYNGKLQYDKSSKNKEEIDLSKKIFISSVDFKYPTVKTEVLMRLQVNQISKDDCLLFMWATNPHLAQAVDLGKAWGFEYKTVAFIWDKMNHNPGQYTLSNCELCLVFKRGRIPRPRGARNVQQLVRSPRKEHSTKPIEVMQAIEKMFPHQERIELFARKKVAGWWTWGLDMINKS